MSSLDVKVAVLVASLVGYSVYLSLACTKLAVLAPILESLR